MTILLEHHRHYHHYSSPKVDPEDVLLIAVLLEHWLEALLETLHRGLAGSEEGEARQLERISLIVCSRFIFHISYHCLIVFQGSQHENIFCGSRTRITGRQGEWSSFGKNFLSGKSKYYRWLEVLHTRHKRTILIWTQERKCYNDQVFPFPNEQKALSALCFSKGIVNYVSQCLRPRPMQSVFNSVGVFFHLKAGSYVALSSNQNH